MTWVNAALAFAALVGLFTSNLGWNRIVRLRRERDEARDLAEFWWKQAHGAEPRPSRMWDWPIPTERRDEQ